MLRYVLTYSVASFAIVTISGCQSIDLQPAAALADIVIENGIVYDGSGLAGRDLDIAIADRQIIFVGQLQSGQFPDAERIDADGLVVAPGFIDPHTHAGSDLKSDDIERRRNLAFAYQGVTTVLIGNDGRGGADVTAQAERLESQKIGTNVAYLAGFGHIRKKIIGDAARAPSDAELGRMKMMINDAMCQGAYGLSAGLYYPPQNFAKTDEVVALAKIAARYGGYYDTHLRDESTYNIGLFGAVEEALEIGKRSGAAVHIAHIKALGPAVWGHSEKIIKRVEEARLAGQIVTADQYPWSASGTRISNALVPRWAMDGGLDGLRQRLADPAILARIRQDMAANLKRRGGADTLLITGNLGQDNVETGVTLAEIAERLSSDPLDAAIDILRVGDARVASFNMNAEDIMTFASQHWVVTGSDGSVGHPRKYGSFPKAYRDFVVRDKLLDLPQFIRRSSGQTADIVGLKDRGYLKPGMAADVVIFDPERYAPRATYQQPRRLSTGVEYLLVNGQMLISGGTHTDEMPGRSLLKDTQC